MKVTKIMVGGPGPRILEGVCEMSGICKKKECVYYRVSKEASRKHLRAIGRLYESDERRKTVRWSTPPENCPLIGEVIYERKEVEND